MEHLIVANLLAGRKKSASEVCCPSTQIQPYSHVCLFQMLRKVYNTLADAFGHDSEQCVATRRKIFALEMKDGSADVSVTTYEQNDIVQNNIEESERANMAEAVSTKPHSKSKSTTKSSRPGKKSKRRHAYEKAEC